MNLKPASAGHRDSVRVSIHDSRRQAGPNPRPTDSVCMLLRGVKQLAEIRPFSNADYPSWSGSKEARSELCINGAVWCGGAGGHFDQRLTAIRGAETDGIKVETHWHGQASGCARDSRVWPRDLNVQVSAANYCRRNSILRAEPPE